VRRVVANARSTVSQTLASSLAIHSVNVAISITVARGLGPADRGLLAAVLLWPALVSTVGALGLADAVTVFIASRSRPIGRTVGAALIIVLLQSAVITAIAAGVNVAVFSSHGDDVLRQALLFTGYIPFSMLTIFVSAYLQGRAAFVHYQLLRFAYVAIALVAIILATIGKLDLRESLIAFFGAHVGAAAIAALIFRNFDGLSGVEIRLSDVRDLAATGAKSHVVNVAALVNERLDQVVISLVLAPVHLGIYAVAVTLMSLTILVGASVSTVAFPRAASAARDERLHLCRRYVRVLLGLTIGVSIPVITCTPYIIQALFGSEFADAVAPARILVAAAVALALARLLGALLKASGLPLSPARGELVGLIVGAVLLLTLLPVVGVIAAAVASLAAYTVTALWLLRRLGSVLHVKPRSLIWRERSRAQLAEPA